MRGEGNGGRFSHPNRRNVYLRFKGESEGREQGGWRVVKTKRMKKIDIASKVKLGDEERRHLVTFFFTNFPDSLKAWDMLHLFSIHGRAVEVVIPGMKEGQRKRFGFVRFKDVRDPDMMEVKLDNVFIRGIKLHVNKPRFNRVVRSDSVAKKEVTAKKVVVAKKEIAGVEQYREGTQKIWVKKKVSEEASGSQLSFTVDDEALQRFRKAMVGEVLWPGKSYNIQEEFSMQGVFWIKATPLGANLVLLEGAADDADFLGDVEEAKDWLLQWFRWVRPWQPEDVDQERVAWIRCFGIPAHAWGGDFFSNLVEPLGTYLYSDDNTERRKTLDVARVLIRTKSVASLNQSISVCINKVMYPIKLVEDWCGPLRWSNQVEKSNTSDDSSELESCFKEEEWREELEDSGKEEEKGVEGGADGGGQEDDDGVKETVNVNLSKHEDVNSKTIDNGVMAFYDSKSPNSLSGTSSSWVKDTISSNVGQDHMSTMGHEGANVGEKGVIMESPVRLILSKPNAVNSSELPSIQFEGIREQVHVLHCDNSVVPREGGEFQRKERRYLSVGIPKNSNLWSKPHRVVHELAEVSSSSKEEAPALRDGGGTNRASSSSLFSAGTVLCDGSIASSDIRMCNNKYWALQSKAVARRVWETSKKLGVEGSRPEEEYIDIISEGEKRDEAARRRGNLSQVSDEYSFFKYAWVGRRS